MTQANLIDCYRCGGNITLELGKTLLKCQYCGGHNLIVGENPIATFSVTSQISRKDATRLARKLMRQSRGLPSMFDSRIRMEKPELMSVPYYEIHGVRIGSLESKTLKQEFKRPIYNVQRNDTPTANIYTRRGKSAYEIDTRIVLSDISLSNVAVQIKDWGLEYVSLSRKMRGKNGIQCKPFDLRELQHLGTVIQPTMTLEQFYKNATRLASRAAGPQADIKFRENGLYYYPFWRIVYWYKAVPYDIVIDASSGKTVFARFPESDEYRILAFLAGIGGLGYVLGLIAPIGIIGISGIEIDDIIPLSFIVFWIVSIFGFFLAGLLSYAWSHIRYPGEIVFRGDYRNVVRVGKIGKTGPEKLYDYFVKSFESKVEPPT